MYHFDPYHRRKASYDGYAPPAYRVQRFYSEPSNQWHEMDFTVTPRSNPLQPSFGHHLNNISVPSSSMTGGHAAMEPHAHQSFSPVPGQQGNSAINYPPFGMYDTSAQRYPGTTHLDGEVAAMNPAENLAHGRRLGLVMEDRLMSNTSTPILMSDYDRRTSDSSERTCPVMTGESDSCQPNRCGTDSTCMEFNNFTPIEECATVPCITSSSRRPSSEPVSPIHVKQDNAGSVRPSVQRASSDKTDKTSSASNQAGSVASQKPSARRRTRVKANADVSIDNPEAMEKATKLRARQAHSLVERKYRENLNMKIMQLHERLQNTTFGPHARLSPSKRMTNMDGGSSVLDVDVAYPMEHHEGDTLLTADPDNDSIANQNSAQLKVRKSDVMVEALNYINSTEIEMGLMASEMARLSAKVQAMEKMMGCQDCSLWKQMVASQVQGASQKRSVPSSG